MRLRRFIFSLTVLTVSGCSTVVPHSLTSLRSSQAILVVPLTPDSHQAVLSAWQRRGRGWQRVTVARAVIGRNGMAASGDKREGDGKTPSGIYALGPAFGYAPSIATGLLYRQAGINDFWVDDVHSLQYNQWVTGKPEAASFEQMHRADHLYQIGIVIGYNTGPIVPGRGSAIFMHVWRRYDRPTAGCVALNQRNLRRILRWLDRNDQPVIILEQN